MYEARYHVKKPVDERISQDELCSSSKQWDTRTNMVYLVTELMGPGDFMLLSEPTLLSTR